MVAKGEDSLGAQELAGGIALGGQRGEEVNGARRCSFLGKHGTIKAELSHQSSRAGWLGWQTGGERFSGSRKALGDAGKWAESGLQLPADGGCSTGTGRGVMAGRKPGVVRKIKACIRFKE